MLHNWFERTDQLFIAAYKIVFFVFGVFGNSCFIFLVVKFTKLRSKSSYLQSIQCLLHTFCLLGTMVDVFLAFPDIQLDRSSCYPIMVPFVFFEIAQAVVMLELVLDILILVQLPGWYKKFDTGNYILLSLVLPGIAGIVFATWGFTNLDDEEIYFCNPTSSLHNAASKNYTRTIVIINTIIISVFSTLIYKFHQKSQHVNSDSSKIMRRLQLSVVIFLISWYITILAYYVCIAAGLEGEDLHFVINNLSFFISLCYSQTFYVIMYKSMEYRKTFYSLIGFRTTPTALSKASSTRITAVAHIQTPVLI